MMVQEYSRGSPYSQGEHGNATWQCIPAPSNSTAAAVSPSMFVDQRHQLSCRGSRATLPARIPSRHDGTPCDTGIDRSAMMGQQRPGSAQPAFRTSSGMVGDVGASLQLPKGYPKLQEGPKTQRMLDAKGHWVQPKATQSIVQEQAVMRKSQPAMPIAAVVSYMDESPRPADAESMAWVAQLKHAPRHPSNQRTNNRTKQLPQGKADNSSYAYPSQHPGQGSEGLYPDDRRPRTPPGYRGGSGYPSGGSAQMQRQVSRTGSVQNYNFEYHPTPPQTPPRGGPQSAGGWGSQLLQQQQQWEQQQWEQQQRPGTAYATGHIFDAGPEQQQQQQRPGTAYATGRHLFDTESEQQQQQQRPGTAYATGRHLFDMAPEQQQQQQQQQQWGQPEQWDEPSSELGQWGGSEDQEQRWGNRAVTAADGRAPGKQGGVYGGGQMGAQPRQQQSGPGQGGDTGYGGYGGQQAPRGQKANAGGGTGRAVTGGGGGAFNGYQDPQASRQQQQGRQQGWAGQGASDVGRGLWANHGPVPDRQQFISEQYSQAGGSTPPVQGSEDWGDAEYTFHPQAQQAQWAQQRPATAGPQGLGQRQQQQQQQQRPGTPYASGRHLFDQGVDEQLSLGQRQRLGQRPGTAYGPGRQAGSGYATPDLQPPQQQQRPGTPTMYGAAGDEWEWQQQPEAPVHDAGAGGGWGGGNRPATQRQQRQQQGQYDDVGSNQGGYPPTPKGWKSDQQQGQERGGQDGRVPGYVATTHFMDQQQRQQEEQERQRWREFERMDSEPGSQWGARQAWQEGPSAYRPGDVVGGGDARWQFNAAPEYPLSQTAPADARAMQAGGGRSDGSGSGSRGAVSSAYFLPSSSSTGVDRRTADVGVQVPTPKGSGYATPDYPSAPRTPRYYFEPSQGLVPGDKRLTGADLAHIKDVNLGQHVTPGSPNAKLVGSQWRFVHDRYVNQALSGDEHLTGHDISRTKPWDAPYLGQHVVPGSPNAKLIGGRYRFVPNQVDGQPLWTDFYGPVGGGRELSAYYGRKYTDLPLNLKDLRADM